jgi:hypothetical protein
VHIPPDTCPEVCPIIYGHCEVLPNDCELSECPEYAWDESKCVFVECEYEQANSSNIVECEPVSPCSSKICEPPEPPEERCSHEQEEVSGPRG